MRRILSLSTRVLLTVVCLAACGGDPLQAQEAAKKPDGQSTISDIDSNSNNVNSSDPAADDAATTARELSTDAGRLELFENEIRPLLHHRCQKCHNDTKSESGLSLASRERLLAGGDSGPAVDLNQPAASLLLKAVRHENGIKMPPDETLEPREITALSRWIANGAAWTPTATPAKSGPTIRSGPPSDTERAHWAFQPVHDPSVPRIDAAGIASTEIGTEWTRNDLPGSAIDRFVLSRLQAAGLQPRRAADRRTWLRRATFDLTGLPATTAEVDEYLRDTSSDATQQVIERLLSSDAYGERWGRHWLDVVRYADTAGETGDYPTPLAYKYRNWVIDALNRDLPYDQFIRQQVAGDLLGAQLVADELNADTLKQREEMLIATGFLAISRRFGFDVENYHYLTIQDTIDTLGQAVLGLSLGCARCHDHKFDPISSQDFYAWYGIFASTRYSFPGSEEKKRPYDLFAVSLTDGTIEALSKEQASRHDAIYGAIDAPAVVNAKVQLRGDPTKLGDEVLRRNLELLGGQPITVAEHSGRAELADWLTRPDNPLTARVIVNRVWQQHFGRGLVATENDFGVRGHLPSHPELLDWLAARFIESGWSLKSLHRLMMSTATYQQSSEVDRLAAEQDPDNRLLWRFPRRRLSAEELRDAMLAVSGQLDLSPGAAHPFPAVDTWGFTQHSPFYADYPSRQRSVYLMQQRLKRHPFLSLFDGADPNSTTGHRELTTVPTQSLFLLNSAFVHECAHSLAAAVVGEDAGQSRSDADRAVKLYQLVFARRPSDQEASDVTSFLLLYEQELQTQDANLTAPVRKLASWAALARTLLIQNEFLFVD